MTAASDVPVRLGIAGLGLAGAFMIRAAKRHPGIALVAGADPLERPRAAFAADFGVKTYDNFEALLADPACDAIYIATPHEMHADQAIAALNAGKHVLVEKPLALTADICTRVVETADRTDRHLIVGHTHGFDPTTHAIAGHVADGALGRLGMILTFNYTDFMYRPRRPEELDTARGGGILFNQVMHQIEIVRRIAGTPAVSVRAATGSLAPERPSEGHASVLLRFANGASATLVYSGYGHFDSDALHDWVSEGGGAKPRDAHATTHRMFRTNDIGEAARQRDLGYGGRDLPDTQPYQPHFGALIVTLEKGDIRTTPDGYAVHSKGEIQEVKLPKTDNGWAGQGEALDALIAAVRHGSPDIHDARWGRASVEIVEAILASSRDDREIGLKFQ